MKQKLLITLASIVLLACSDKREPIIADYVQRIGNTKMELDFKLVSIKDLETITAKDSLALLDPTYENKKLEFINGYNQLIDTYTSLQSSASDQLHDYNTDRIWQRVYKTYELNEKKNVLQKQINDYQLKIDDFSDQVNKVKTDQIENIENFEERSGKELKELKNIILAKQKYAENPETILAKRVEVVYKVKNPMFNNVVQEINKVLILSGDEQRVLETVEN